LKGVYNDDERILLETSKKIVRRMEYFKMLLNGDVSDNPIPRWEKRRAEQDNVGQIIFEETKIVINSLKN